MKNPKISILMGIYNCSNTLEEAVESIKQQTYSNWELIMCDDGSTDDTYARALEIASKNDKCVVIKNEKNIGLAATLNHCLEYATGEYVARMDGDDTCDPTRLKKEINVLEKYEEYAFVSTGMSFFDETGIHGELIYREKPQGIDFIGGSQFCHASSMMRKDALVAIGGYNTSIEVERVEDFDLWVRMYDAGFVGYNIPEVLYSMRDDRNAYSRRKMKYRLNEAGVIARVVNRYGTSWRHKVSVLRPIVIGCLPGWLYKILHQTRLSK